MQRKTELGFTLSEAYDLNLMDHVTQLLDQVNEIKMQCIKNEVQKFNGVIMMEDVTSLLNVPKRKVKALIEEGTLSTFSKRTMHFFFEEKLIDYMVSLND